MESIINGILLANLTFLATLIVTYIIASIAVWIDGKLNPIYPHCDIDPLGHPSFIVNHFSRPFMTDLSILNTSKYSL